MCFLEYELKVCSYFLKQNGKLCRKIACHRKGAISVLPNTRDSYLPCRSPMMGSLVYDNSAKTFTTIRRNQVRFQLQTQTPLRLESGCGRTCHLPAPPGDTTLCGDSTSSDTRKHQPPFMTGFSYILSLCSVSSIKVQVTRLLSCGQVSTSRP